MEDKEIINQKLKESPKEIQDYLSNKEWLRVITDVTAKEGLNVEQKQALENEILFIFLGLDLPRNLVQNLTKELKIETVRAENISKVLNEKILKPLELFLPTEEVSEIETKNEDKEPSEDEWKRPQLASLPNYSDYEQGKDPYREPIE